MMQDVIGISKKTQLTVSTGSTVEIYSFVFFFSEIGVGGGGGGEWAFTWYITLYTILVQK